jgi:hypothetical protein
MNQTMLHSQLAPGITPSHLPEELSEFVTADFPPMDSKPVLAIRESGYNRCRYEIVTAYYDARHYPANPWRGVDGDAITDSGSRVLGWKNALRWLQAR